MDVDYEDVEVLPQRPVVSDKPKTKKEITQEQRTLDKKNKKRRDARDWRKRAEKVGIEKPKQGRQTPAQRKAWQEKVELREKALNIKD
jgi:hypothetical protein